MGLNIYTLGGDMKNILVVGLSCMCLFLVVIRSVESPSPEVVVYVPADIQIEYMEPKSTDPTLQIMSFPEHGLQYKDIDVFCLAKNIFHEAGIESDIGKYAVAKITINRLQSPRYPDNICSVVLDRYQFSWANQRSKHWTRPKGPNWDASYRIALNVLEDGDRVVGLDNAHYYHADYVNPHWASQMTPVTTIGRHIFYTRH